MLLKHNKCSVLALNKWSSWEIINFTDLFGFCAISLKFIITFTNIHTAGNVILRVGVPQGFDLLPFLLTCSTQSHKCCCYFPAINPFIRIMPLTQLSKSNRESSHYFTHYWVQTSYLKETRTFVPCSVHLWSVSI